MATDQAGCSVEDALRKMTLAQNRSIGIGYGPIPPSLDRLRPRRYRLRQHAERHRLKHKLLAQLEREDWHVDLDGPLTLF